ncbi:hypothetical protein [Amycolatopsis anabasis]|uniref:hypothetical protein n=1 Tax=Amycolatopsis anabasis TaxID=1840409 RepID=UPI00131E2883|nr:hypothetical protein [Amycolatopsis anabasis]
MTFFGLGGGVETDDLRALAEKWARENGVKFAYREATPAVRAEYNIGLVPTIRYFDERSGKPRIEAKLRTEILRFLKEESI